MTPSEHCDHALKELGKHKASTCAIKQVKPPRNANAAGNDCSRCIAMVVDGRMARNGFSANVKGLVMRPRGVWRRRRLGRKRIGKCPINTGQVCHARHEQNGPALDPSASSVGQSVAAAVQDCMVWGWIEAEVGLQDDSCLADDVRQPQASTTKQRSATTSQEAADSPLRGRPPRTAEGSTW